MDDAVPLMMGSSPSPPHPHQASMPTQSQAGFRRRGFNLFLIQRLCLILTSTLPIVSALDADTAAIGEWNLRLQSHALEWVFPDMVSTAESTPLSNVHPLSLWRRQILASQPCDCHLSLFSNGTFALSPCEKLEATSTGTTATSTPSKLRMHGQWKAANNPYCATDRFYQNIQLRSYPRHQRQRNADQVGGKPAFANRHQMIQYGRLQGHFSRQHQYRITHGKILYQPSNASTVWWALQQRPILGSFRAVMARRESEA